MTSKIDVFSDSIKIALSDLQNKEHENSQLKVLKKNVKLLKNEIKSKGTIIESLLETQKTLTKYLPKKIPKPFQSIENYNQQQLRQQYSQNQAQQYTSIKKVKLLLKKQSKVPILEKQSFAAK